MEIAICTRCQSNNPIFTKFCLTCGLAITSEMKRTIVASSSVATQMAPAANVVVNTEPLATATSPQANAQTEHTSNQPQSKGAGWLKSLFSK